MEDFMPIFWIVFLIAMVGFSAISQRKKEKKHAHSEAWPSWDPETAPTSAPKVDNSTLEQEFEDGTDAEPAYTDENRYAGFSSIPNPKSRYVAQLTTVPPDPAFRKAEQQEMQHNQAECDETDDITADFELRKAVIYSEILKPKFDE